jgi:hypothetical protein
MKMRRNRMLAVLCALIKLVGTQLRLLAELEREGPSAPPPPHFFFG